MEFSEKCPDAGEVKAVFSDFDYTFLDKNHQVSELNAVAFGRLRDSGFMAGIASGRARPGTLSCIPASLKNVMKYNGYPGIFLNGGVVYDDKGNLISETTIRKESKVALLEKMKEMNILNNILGYTAEKVCCLELNEYTAKSWKEYKEPAPEVIPLEGPNGFLETNFIKLVVCGTIESTDKNRNALENAVKSQLRCVRPLNWNLEFVDPSVTKANGMKKLLSHLKINPANVLAMGDGENDVEMLQYCNTSISVENAKPKVKEIAKYSTVSCDESAFHRVAVVVLNAQTCKQ